MRIAIRNARIYDPVTGKNGEAGNVFIEDGKISKKVDSPELEIDAGGRILMAGAIDVCSHLATYGLNFLRSSGLLAGADSVAEAYVRLGYTFINEAFVTLETAGYTHYELSDIPWLDTSILLSVPLYDLETFIRNDDVEKCVRVLSTFGELSKCVGFRLFEPELYYEQEIYSHRNINSEVLLSFFSRVSEALGVKIFVHPGPSSVSLVSGYPESYHLCSIRDILEERNGGSASGENDTEVENILRSGISVDMGFLPSGRSLRILPEKPETEGFLSRFDVGLTHPVYYLIEEKKDGDSEKRLIEILRKCDSGSVVFSMAFPVSDFSGNYASAWAKIASTMGLSFLARITRSAPAKVLGIADRGHLKSGASADVVIYDLDDANDEESMKNAFSSCWYLIKDGKPVISEGKLTDSRSKGKTWYRAFPEVNMEEARKILNQSSFRPENMEVKESLAGTLMKL